MKKKILVFNLVYLTHMMDDNWSKTFVDALPVELDYIPEELKIRATEELCEDEDRRIQSLNSLKSLLREVKDLHWQDDDSFLLAFLRSRKFDIKKAFSLVKNFYTCLGKHSHLYYMGFDPFKRIMKENNYYILSQRDSEGSAVLYFHFYFWNPDDISAEAHIVCATLGILQALRSPATQIAGFKIIADLRGFALKHLLQMTPSNISFWCDVIQNTFPMRIRGMHIVNENRLFSLFFPIIKRLLSKKLNERIHIHGKDMKSLHKYFHPSILPANLEGELPEYDMTEWQQRMQASADYIEHVLSFGYEKYLTKDWKEEFKDYAKK